MVRTTRIDRWIRLWVGAAIIALAAALLAVGVANPARAYAANELGAAEMQGQNGETPAKYDATLYKTDGTYPGVYKTVPVEPNTAATAADAPTIHIPSIADTALANAPTTESPAIICGTAVPNANTENARQFTAVSSQRVAPYEYFKYGVTTVKEADGKTEKKGPDGQPIKKLTGFDGTYVIVRIDVSKLFVREDNTQIKSTDNDAGDYYLHVQQAKNNALLVAIGQEGKTFSALKTVGNAQVHYKVGSYNLAEMFDKTGADTTTPYLDVILFSTASLVSGADAQKTDALNGDVELSFYVDKEAQAAEPAEAYDPTKTFDTTEAQAAYVESYFKKYYDESKATGGKISRYTVKGSELALETIVLDTTVSAETAAKVEKEPWKFKTENASATFWSLAKSMQHEYYDQEIDKSKDDPNCGRTVTLISEVPVATTLHLERDSESNLKKRTLNVNSYDIQIANNKSPEEGSTYNSGLVLKNAWLKLEDLSNTTGAELAIGNNANMTIDTGGRLIVDKTCQLEIEWDGATTAPGQAQPTNPETLNNGSLDLREGGTLENYGVVTVEGTEGKPYQPGTDGAQPTAPESEKGQGEMTIRKGASFYNYGVLAPNGSLYILGTLINYGNYKDVITSNDPDKGKFDYHCGIQASWKDDVTQKNIIYGGIYVGIDKSWKNIETTAVLDNRGDIVLCPGALVNFGTLKNVLGGNIYSCATDRAVVPIEPDPNNPTVITKTVTFDKPQAGYINNLGTFVNDGRVLPGEIELKGNGILGDLSTPGRFPDYFTLLLPDLATYSGSGQIYQHDASKVTVDLENEISSSGKFPYTGKAQKFGVYPKMNGYYYVSDYDFTETYLDPSGKVIEKSQIVNAGTYQLVLTGSKTFTGEKKVSFTVTPIALTAGSLNATSFTYDGKVHKPTAQGVKAGSFNPTASDYTVTYSPANPTNVGTYTATITGKGNFSGSIKNTFKINAASIAKAKVSGLKSKAFTGKAIKQVPTVKLGTATLKAGTDFTVAYKNNKKVGKVTVTITGKGNYTGTVKAAFKIVKAKNTAKVTVKAKTAKLAKVKKKAQAVKPITVKAAKGKVTYAKVAKGSSKKLTVNKKTGKVTVKKGTKKGTYKIRVKVKVAGNAGYKAFTKTVVAKVRVK